MAAHGHAPLRLHDISPHVGYVRVRLVDGAVQWELRQFVARLISRSTAKFLKDPCRSKGCSRSEFVSISVAGSLAPGFLACVVPSRRQLWIAWLWIAWSYIPLVCRRRARAGLDGFASSCIQSPTVDASIQDIVRCSLAGSYGKRRRLDPHITGLASIKRNVSQAGMCVSLAAAPHSPDQSWHFAHPTAFGPPFPVHARPQRPCFGLGLFRPLGEPACLLVFIDVLRARVCTGVCVTEAPSDFVDTHCFLHIILLRVCPSV